MPPRRPDRQWPNSCRCIKDNIALYRGRATLSRYLTAPRNPGRASPKYTDMTPIISVSKLDKVYASGFHALKQINLDIHRGEIFALLGPNGAGKTTLISILCGLVNPTGGNVHAYGHESAGDYRAARPKTRLGPQDPT